MCGITGCVFNNGINFSYSEFEKINSYISYRGPDSTSALELKKNNLRLFFGFNRLSIIDLSQNGNQPMTSNNGRYTILYNGEIYNHLELKSEITKNNFFLKGTSDTEILLEYFAKFKNNFLEKLNGMFAFAIYDNVDNVIHFARDRAGEKPLYIYFNDGMLGFSSELKTIYHFPNFNKKISKEAVYKYFNYNYIPSPITIYENCFKLPQATYLKIDLNKFPFKKIDNFENLKSISGVEIKKYWNLNNKNKSSKYELIETNLKNLDFLINSAVKKQLISDVPIGTFLSGGLDSSLITAIVSKYKKKPNTFSIGFDFDQYDESKKAKKISEKLKTNHHSHIFSKNDFIDNISNIPKAFSEPFADSSQLPTMLVSKLARKEVAVVLTGDGGDEIFGGYQRYIYYKKYEKILKLFNKSIFNLLKKIIKNFPYSLQIFFISLILQKKININELQKILIKLDSFSNDISYYSSMISQSFQNQNFIDYNSLNEKNLSKFFNIQNLSSVESMMYSDFYNYLSDDIMCKVDRSSMFYSLETRAPYLDKNIVEFMFNKHENLKIYNNKSKLLLRQLSYKYFSKDLVDNQKFGFAIPIASWLKSDLKNWANDILMDKNSIIYDYIEKKEIEQIIYNHQNNRENNEHKIWSLIQLNLWYNQYFK